MKTVTSGSLVAVHYTGRLDNGEVFDSSEDGEPLKFAVGSGQLIKGFDDGVMGMTVDQTKEIVISPADAYGDRDDERVFTVDRSQMGDPEFEPEVGMTVGLQMGNGEHTQATVTSIDKKSVTLDLNHPLAGQTLHFSIKVVEIRTAGEPGTEGWGERCGSHGCGEGGCGGCGDDDDGGCDEHGHGGCCGHKHG